MSKSIYKTSSCELVIDFLGSISLTDDLALQVAEHLQHLSTGEALLEWNQQEGERNHNKQPELDSDDSCDLLSQSLRLLVTKLKCPAVYRKVRGGGARVNRGIYLCWSAPLRAAPTSKCIVPRA